MYHPEKCYPTTALGRVVRNFFGFGKLIVGRLQGSIALQSPSHNKKSESMLFEVFHPGSLGGIEGIIERLTVIQIELELLIE